MCMMQLINTKSYYYAWVENSVNLCHIILVVLSKLINLYIVILEVYIFPFTVTIRMR